ncbi:hypothetical protein HAX54_049089, partial [Datura stramonium]|nr:hypothetical protein [Datura stramonium]
MSMTKDRGIFVVNGQRDTSREGERERAEKEEEEVGGGMVSYSNSEATRGKEGRRWMIFPVVAGGFPVIGDVVGENRKKGFPAGGLHFFRLGWRRLGGRAVSVGRRRGERKRKAWWLCGGWLVVSVGLVLLLFADVNGGFRRGEEKRGCGLVVRRRSREEVRS